MLWPWKSCFESRMCIALSSSGISFSPAEPTSRETTTALSRQWQAGREGPALKCSMEISPFHRTPTQQPTSHVSEYHGNTIHPSPFLSFFFSLQILTRGPLHFKSDAPSMFHSVSYLTARRYLHAAPARSKTGESSDSRSPPAVRRDDDVRSIFL